MKYTILLGIGLLLGFASCNPSVPTPPANHIALAIHGGAGTIKKTDLTPEKEAQYIHTLDSALTAAYTILQQGGTSLDATQAAVVILEDSPLFNAGKGAVFTNKGTNELDAAIMDGATLKAGAVAGVRHIKNPIKAARAVMDSSKYVLLSGEGADRFAAKRGLDMVDTTYYYTPERWEQLLRVRDDDTTTLDHSKKTSALPHAFPYDYKYGTVGAVALDKYGNLAAATSTGGLVNKRYGRIGDSPLIGAGTYADNRACAISCTGKGEHFIRLTVARTIAALVEYKHYTIQQAADTVLTQLSQMKGTGGLIAVDRNGNLALPFNTDGMYRAYIDTKGIKNIQIYK